MIGDSNRPQNMPGLAPRAFQDIFAVLNENKAKYELCDVQCYMVELYCDKLNDLLADPSKPKEVLLLSYDSPPPLRLSNPCPPLRLTLCPLRG